MDQVINGIRNNPGRMLLIAGPCVVEGRDMCLHIAEKVKNIGEKLDMITIFKASYKKANRSNLSSFTGLGDQEGLKILEEVRVAMNMPVLTDVHETPDLDMVAAYDVDIAQIPAFLSRQTDLLVKAGSLFPFVNVKKGQWSHPDSMRHAVEKVQSGHNGKGEGPLVMLTERGSSFGYNSLVVDMTNIPAMKKYSTRVIVDCTHSVQAPGAGQTTGGNPQYIETIALSGTAAGATGLFLEVHPKPKEAKSDAASMLQIDKLEAVLAKAKRIKDSLDGHE
jgi:2-dehydro-3-deoxyphosphooctonate aldolase (KDO 8-P synthase)